MGNNPIKYTDPDGREIDTSELNESQLLEYQNTEQQLKKTDRGNQLLDNLKKSPIKFKILINDKGQNFYNPSDKTINWDMNKTIITGDDTELTPPTLLAHEMGHAEQDMNNELPKNPTNEQRLKVEHENLLKTENPISQSINKGVRHHYDDWKYTTEKGHLNEINTIYYKKN